MQITEKKLPKNRRQFTINLTEQEIAQYFTHALEHLAPTVKISGFRPGKAPASLIREQIKPEILREEAYSLAVRDVWQKVAHDLKELPIEDPSVEVIEFMEGKSGSLTFSFDIRPEVTLKNWKTIKIKPVSAEKVDEKQIDDVIDNLARSRAQTTVKLEAAENGDKVDVTFTGYLGSVKKDKLSAERYPVVLGQGNAIPGFEKELIGLKKNDTKRFSITFPKDHFDKELAGQEVTFEVKIEDVYLVKLPERDDEFAKQFGHKTVAEMKKAIEKELQEHNEEEAFIQQKAKWLSEFEKTVQAEVPESLIVAEVNRSRQAWSEFLTSRQINPQDWLNRRGTTLEEMEKDWRKAAESTIKVGLGLAEVAKELGKELKDNQAYEALLTDLVQQSVKTK